MSSILKDPKETHNDYPKLVRDNIPQIIKDHDGVQVPIRTLDDEEFLKFLLKKVVEEAKELALTTEVNDLIEEIADVQEVIDTILKLKSISHKQVKIVQDDKRNKRGSFEQRLVMISWR